MGAVRGTIIALARGVGLEAAMRRRRAERRLAKMRTANAGATNADVFSGIYRDRIWGRSGTGGADFDSGRGSEPEATAHYEDAVARFITVNQIVSVLDIGCGDFQVSRRILGKVGHRVRYIGCDVVRDLVERNNTRFGGDGIRFQVLDAARDPLPGAQLFLCREVLQHLPNADIAEVLHKCRSFRFGIITNTVSSRPRSINTDIPAGPWTRASLGSGLWVDKPPFELPVEVLFDIAHPTNPGSRLLSVLYQG